MLEKIFNDCGLSVLQYEPVYGGDINETFCLHSAGKKYFLKINDDALLPRMFEKEANGLKALQRSTSLIIPEVINHGVAGNKQYLLLEWIEAGNTAKDGWEQFGIALATMHRIKQPFFGWADDNYIGSLYQVNHQHSSWHSFYTVCRIIPLAKKLFEKSLFTKQDMIATDLLCQKSDQLFPSENPALLHGDLWSGNFMFNDKGEAVLYDPAVYYGHREMDLGMTMLFGGFNERFYKAYHNVYPLETGWQQRLSIAQLYPVLVHAVLFNGHYVENAKQIIKSYL